jgi:hypothetical protein
MECARLQNTPTTASTLIHCHCAINFNADKLEATAQKRLNFQKAIHKPKPSILRQKLKIPYRSRRHNPNFSE